MESRKVKMTTGVAGKGYTLKSGQETDLPAPMAERFVERGIAVYLDDPPPAAKPKAKRGRKATRPPAEQRDK